jgi:hypothetical protein
VGGRPDVQPSAAYGLWRASARNRLKRPDNVPPVYAADSIREGRFWGSGACRDFSVEMRSVIAPRPLLCECHRPFVLPRPATTPTATAERKLPLPNSMGQLDASNRDGGVRERLEPGDRSRARPRLMVSPCLRASRGMCRPPAGPSSHSRRKKPPVRRGSSISVARCRLEPLKTVGYPIPRKADLA